MTRFKFIDKRTEVTPTFKDIKLGGDMFTIDPDDERIYIKLDRDLVNDGTGENYNVIDSYGEPWLFNDDDEVYPIRKITFNIEE